ncbi:MAG: hypothetical protein PHD62_05235 [Bacteroidales bacterium]|nr:hypothetical protein [Bacteroidales bacterium]
MKTKKLLVLILLLGLSLNAFSQEEVTIKQVIKNSSTNAASYGDAIKVIKIWTKIPVTIRSGKENAIYLTGEMKDNEKDKLSSFCVLKNNVFEISSPYLFLDEESKAKDFSKFRITLELADNVYTYYLRGDNNVTISKDIITDGNGTFNLWANSQIIIEGEAKFEVLNIFAQENSKIRFNSINANGAILNMEKGSIIDLNGKVRDIEIMNQEEGAKLIGEHKGTSLMRHNVDVEDDDFMKRLKIDKAENIISSKGDTISWNPNNADLIIGKNSKVNIVFSDKIKEGYISNYPIKGYEKDKLIIQDDYPVDLVLTIKKDIGNITLKEGAKVMIDSEIKGETRSYYLFNNAELIFNNKVEVNELEVSLNNASKAMFKNLKADNLFIQGNGSSELEINGEIEKLNRYKYDDINITGDNKISSIKEKKLKTLELTLPILNVEEENDNSNLKVTNKYKSGKELDRDKINIGFVFNYGILNWSKRVGKVDDLFSSPGNEYALKYSDNGGFGLKFKYKPTRKVLITTGVGMEYNSFSFANNLMMTNNNGDKRLAYETNLAIDAESKLVANYITIPLHVQYFFYKKFSIHAGGIFAINYRSSSTGFQRVYDTPNAEITEKWGRNYDNFKPIKLEVQAGIGWSICNLYVKYSLTPLFKDNKEIAVYPFSVGFSLGI